MAESKTYTAEEYDALSSKVSDLQSKVDELTAAAGDAEVEAKVSAVKADLEAQVTDLQGKLDSAVAEAEVAKQTYTDLVAYLEAEDQAKAEAAALEARKAERVAMVKELASFPEDHIEANADRWAEMPEDAFAAAFEDWKTIAAAKASAKSTESAETEIPNETAMTASRTDNKTTGDSPVREVFDLRLNGANAKSL